MEIINKLYELFKKDLSKIILLLLIVIIGVFIYPIYDLHFGYLNRLEQRANVLKILSEMKSPSIHNKLALEYEYNGIVKELSSYNPSIESTFKQYFSVSKNKPTLTENIYKTIAGSIVWLLPILLLISTGKFEFNIRKPEKTNKNSHKKSNDEEKSLSGVQITFISLSIIGCIIGYIIPLFNDVSINYVLIPAIELLLFLIINKIFQTAKQDS